jgi:bifunctional UDP-N-acetylglucosamine pyrophosphorylase/glucosamine-1-phosphate N-acetyltransferase
MTAVILAAGQSKRMGAGVPKVLIEVHGRPLLGYLLDTVREAGVERVIVVTGSGRSEVETAFANRGVEFAVQPEQRGTADAVLACRDILSDDEDCIVLCGDAPLVRSATIRRLGQVRAETGADVAVLTARLADPTGYGRVVRGDGSWIREIVEHRDASPDVRRIDEVNSGAYSFRWGRLRPLLEQLEPSPVSGEYYLTDAVRAVTAAGGRVVALLTDDQDEILGANTPEQLGRITELLALRASGAE